MLNGSGLTILMRATTKTRIIQGLSDTTAKTHKLDHDQGLRINKAANIDTSAALLLFECKRDSLPCRLSDITVAHR